MYVRQWASVLYCARTPCTCVSGLVYSTVLGRHVCVSVGQCTLLCLHLRFHWRRLSLRKCQHWQGTRPAVCDYSGHTKI